MTNRSNTGEPVGDDPTAILRARALRLARAPQPAADDALTLELLEFRLANELYAVETRHVVEVYPLKALTRVPCTPAFILGIANVRGRLISVLDIKKFFRLPEKGLTDLHRIVVLRWDEFDCGLMADAIVGVRQIAAERLQPAMPSIEAIPPSYVKGLAPERTVLLDVPRIIGDPAMIVHEEVQT